ncbi:MAG: T9SS type A sorting domain-containing protein [Candidatus Cloacimonetes bacterium]|jgi:hypothetical protein|nr:T9SS type A sorting domain-containing protein [Candidatus Cloacimonadota bacterium]MDY0171944.1 T9SS type A sorting domain-containing protein [Candidatus Cloacimonadaceae bacterium]
MKPIKVILLFVVLNLMAFTMLSASIKPGSPEYDAWKIDQIKPHTPTLGQSNPIASNSKAQSNSARDPYNLLIPLDGSFTLAMTPNDDGYTEELTLPFTYSLYGETYDTFFINNNGNVSFVEGLYQYTPWAFPFDGYPMLAPFFADVDTRDGYNDAKSRDSGGAVWYKMEPNRVIVIWDHVGYYGQHIDKLNTFELIFSDGTDPTIGLGNTVAFSYADMSWTTGDASDGIDGFGGTPATVGINKGDEVTYTQIGRFDHPGIDFNGPDLPSGVDWLDGQVFYFDTGAVATVSVYPTTYDTALSGIEPPAGFDPYAPDTYVYYADYPAVGLKTVQIPVGPGLWKGWIYYNAAWHEADDFPYNGPGTLVFSNVPFGAKSLVPFLFTLEAPTLPVELSSFTATQTAQNTVKLTWISESETGLMGYRIYRNLENAQHSAMMITPIMIDATNTSSTHIYSITDAEVEVDNTYWYWLESVDFGSSEFYGPVSYLVEGDTPALTPEQTVMKNAYPNPFKALSGTTIEVDVKDNDGGSIAIYNLAGQEVKSFSVSPGNNNINWDGKDSRGKTCATGVYFYKLSTNSLNQTRKMLIVK